MSCGVLWVSPLPTRCVQCYGGGAGRLLRLPVHMMEAHGLLLTSGFNRPQSTKHMPAHVLGARIAQLKTVH